VRRRLGASELGSSSGEKTRQRRTESKKEERRKRKREREREREARRFPDKGRRDEDNRIAPLEYQWRTRRNRVFEKNGFKVECGGTRRGVSLSAEAPPSKEIARGRGRGEVVIFSRWRRVVVGLLRRIATRRIRGWHPLGAAVSTLNDRLSDWRREGDGGGRHNN